MSGLQIRLKLDAKQLVGSRLGRFFVRIRLVLVRARCVIAPLVRVVAAIASTRILRATVLQVFGQQTVFAVSGAATTRALFHLGGVDQLVLIAVVVFVIVDGLHRFGGRLLLPVARNCAHLFAGFNTKNFKLLVRTQTSA